MVHRIETRRIIHQNGQPVNSLKTAWKLAKEKSGINRRLRMYDLRHFFVTAAIEGGLDYKTLSEMWDHLPKQISLV